jgi:hypothetical protein
MDRSFSDVRASIASTAAPIANFQGGIRGIISTMRLLRQTVLIGGLIGAPLIALAKNAIEVEFAMTHLITTLNQMGLAGESAAEGIKQTAAAFAESTGTSQRTGLRLLHDYISVTGDVLHSTEALTAARKLHIATGRKLEETESAIAKAQIGQPEALSKLVGLTPREIDRAVDQGNFFDVLFRKIDRDAKRAERTLPNRIKSFFGRFAAVLTNEFSGGGLTTGKSNARQDAERVRVLFQSLPIPDFSDPESIGKTVRAAEGKILAAKQTRARLLQKLQADFKPSREQELAATKAVAGGATIEAARPKVDESSLRSYDEFIKKLEQQVSGLRRAAIENRDLSISERRLLASRSALLDVQGKLALATEKNIALGRVSSEESRRLAREADEAQLRVTAQEGREALRKLSLKPGGGTEEERLNILKTTNQKILQEMIAQKQREIDVDAARFNAFKQQREAGIASLGPDKAERFGRLEEFLKSDERFGKQDAQKELNELKKEIEANVRNAKEAEGDLRREAGLPRRAPRVDERQIADEVDRLQATLSDKKLIVPVQLVASQEEIDKLTKQGGREARKLNNGPSLISRGAPTGGSEETVQGS